NAHFMFVILALVGQHAPSGRLRHNPPHRHHPHRRVHIQMWSQVSQERRQRPSTTILHLSSDSWQRCRWFISSSAHISFNGSCSSRGSRNSQQHGKKEHCQQQEASAKTTQEATKATSAAARA